MLIRAADPAGFRRDATSDVKHFYDVHAILSAMEAQTDQGLCVHLVKWLQNEEKEIVSELVREMER